MKQVRPKPIISVQPSLDTEVSNSACGYLAAAFFVHGQYHNHPVPSFLLGQLLYVCMTEV